MDYRKIAVQYGLTERIGALEKALLSVKGITEVTFDLNGYLDDIYQVIVIARYRIESGALGDYYRQHGKIPKDMVAAANRLGLCRTSDAIEDMGEHFYIVFSSSKWNDNREFGLFYDHNGHRIPVGSEGWVPTRKIANRLLAYHEQRPINKGVEIYIAERVKERLYQPMKRFNGKVVYNSDYLYWNALQAGEYVTGQVAQYIENAMMPACQRTDCLQLGEPSATKIDDEGRERNVFITLRKVTDEVYEYCGKCFRGENAERGRFPVYA